MLSLVAEISLASRTSILFAFCKRDIRTCRLSFFLSSFIGHVFHITKNLAALAIPVNSPISHTTRCSSQTTSLHHPCFTERGPRRLHTQCRPDSHRQSDPPLLGSQKLWLTSASSMALSFQSPLLNSAQRPLPPP